MKKDQISSTEVLTVSEATDIRNIQWYRLILSIVFVVMIGFLSSVFTSEAVTYYTEELTLPVYAPPSWLFGPVWTVLYILIGISYYFILRMPKSRHKRQIEILFIVQLLLNFFWSLIFFRLESNIGALLEIGVLLSVLTILQYKLKSTNILSMWLLVPYYLWVAFATALTIGIVFLNGF